MIKMGLISNTEENINDEKRSLLESSNEHQKPIWKQYMTAFLASTISFSSGCIAAWSSPATPQLLNGTANELGGIRALTIEEVSWVASLTNLGALFGSIPAGYLSFKWGRKNCLLSLAVPYIVGWLMIIFNFNNVCFLYIGRFISGISYGASIVALPIYNNEICIDRIRGRIGMLFDLMQCAGLLWVYALMALTSLLWVTIMCLLIPIIFLISFMWMPESPLYLVRNGENEEAIRSIKWLQGEDCDVHLELARIHRALMEGKNNQDVSLNINAINAKKECENYTLCCSWWNSVVKLYKNNLSNVSVKAILIAFSVFILQRSSGAALIQSYTNTVFELAGSPSPGGAAVCIGIASLLSSLVSIVTIDFVGRKILLAFSFFIMFLSISIFIGYLFVILNEDTFAISSKVEQNLKFIPTISLCIFVAMFRLGVSPIPWFMTPEIIPIETQRWATSTIVCISWGLAFLLSKCFLPAINAFGQIPVYAFFAIVCAIGVINTWIFVPETKNKSREQIQSELARTKVSTGSYGAT